MNDNDVWQIILPLIQTPLRAETGLASLDVIQTYQPTTQGVPNPPFLMLHRIHAHKYGHPHRAQVYNSGNDNFDTTDTHIIEATYQARSLATQNPSDITQPTAFDVAEAAARVMQTDSFMDALRAQDINIYRITDVRVPYFVDDRQRH